MKELGRNDSEEKALNTKNCPAGVVRGAKTFRIGWGTRLPQRRWDISEFASQSELCVAFPAEGNRFVSQNLRPSTSDSPQPWEFVEV